MVNLQHYKRGINIEFHGIPEDVKDEDLKDKVIAIASCIDVNIKKAGIEACHWLPNKKKVYI